MGNRRLLGFAVTGTTIAAFGLSLSVVGFTSTGSNGVAGPWPVFGALVAFIGVVLSATAAAAIRD